MQHPLCSTRVSGASGGRTVCGVMELYIDSAGRPVSLRPEKHGDQDGQTHCEEHISGAVEGGCGHVVVFAAVSLVVSIAVSVGELCTAG